MNSVESSIGSLCPFLPSSGGATVLENKKGAASWDSCIYHTRWGVHTCAKTKRLLGLLGERGMQRPLFRLRQHKGLGPTAVILYCFGPTFFLFPRKKEKKKR